MRPDEPTSKRRVASSSTTSTKTLPNGRERTQGRGVDQAFEGVGTTARTSLRALRPGGRLVLFGQVTAVRGAREAGKLEDGGSLRSRAARELRPGRKRTSIYSIQWLARRHPDWFREDLATFLAMLAENESHLTSPPYATWTRYPQPS